MRIDFDRLEVFTDLEKRHCTVVSVRRDFANLLYQRGQGIACHALALKLWNTPGEQDFDEEEAQIITRMADTLCSPAMIDAIKGRMSKGQE